MVVNYKILDKENVYFGMEEDLYDYFRGMDCIRQEDNIYDYVLIVGEFDYFSFNIDVGRNIS